MKLKRLKIPPQHLNKGFFISAVGLAIIFWAQAAFHMFERPTETAWLLLAMLGSAVLFALLFECWGKYRQPRDKGELPLQLEAPDTVIM